MLDERMIEYILVWMLEVWIEYGSANMGGKECRVDFIGFSRMQVLRS